MKKGIHEKENSFTVLRLPVPWYSERVCRHWSSQYPSHWRKGNYFRKKMKNQNLQPQITFSTCTNPNKKGVKTPSPQVF